jgi:hypothetical protein
MDQVHTRRVARQLHTISRLPRTFGAEAKPTTSSGRVQLGENLIMVTLAQEKNGPAYESEKR